MQKGYIATLTVLIVMAVVIATATTVTYLSIGEAQSSFALFKGEDTLSFVEGCVEDALLKTREHSGYNGGTITRPEGTCSITVDSKVGDTWTITVTTQATNYKRTIRVVFDRLVPGISITSWKEV